MHCERSLRHSGQDVWAGRWVCFGDAVLRGKPRSELAFRRALAAGTEPLKNCRRRKGSLEGMHM